MQFQLLMRSFVYAILIASTRATKIEFMECKFEVKDADFIKMHKPCESNGDTISLAFEILKEISDDEIMNVLIKSDGETVSEKKEEKILGTFENDKPYTDYNEECGFNLFSPVSTGMREIDSCRVDGNAFQGMENKEFEIYVTNNILDVTIKAKILEDS